MIASVTGLSCDSCPAGTWKYVSHIHAAIPRDTASVPWPHKFTSSKRAFTLDEGERKRMYSSPGLSKLLRRLMKKQSLKQ